MKDKDKLLVEVQSNFRKNIRSSGLVYMALYDLIKAGQPITPEGLSEVVYMPLKFIMDHEYIWSEYIDYLNN